MNPYYRAIVILTSSLRSVQDVLRRIGAWGRRLPRVSPGQVAVVWCNRGAECGTDHSRRGGRRCHSELTQLGVDHLKEQKHVMGSEFKEKKESANKTD